MKNNILYMQQVLDSPAHIHKMRLQLSQNTKQFPFRTGNQPLLNLKLLFHHKTATNNTFMGEGGTNVAQQTGNRNVQLDVVVHCKTVMRSCITGTH
jgi:hypothetical protein